MQSELSKIEQGLEEAIAFPKRQNILNYALEVARVVATRSEDPYRKVGAVILDSHQRIISTGYNGLAPGYNPPPSFWQDHDARKPFMIHAEINALSYIKRDDGNIMIVTLKPCPSCLKACIAHGIRTIWYAEDKAGLEESDRLAKLYGIAFNKM